MGADGRLHFSDDLLKRLSAAGVAVVRVTLHVGLDTFQPKSPHAGRSTRCTANGEQPEAVRPRSNRGEKRPAAVPWPWAPRPEGALESAAPRRIWPHFAGHRVVHPGTAVHVSPPRRRTASKNFWPPPRTTLLVLVRHAFGGDALVRRAYEQAIREEYRFYSYGDAMC